MKTKSLLTLAAMLGALSLTAFAQDAGGPPGQDGPPQGGPGGGPGGQGGQRRMMPQPLIVKALDKNNDGVIDADEIAGASDALKSLDKNGDGKLTRDEFLGKPPMGNNRHPMGGGQGGPEGQGGPGGDGPQGPPPQQ